jgi:hypothetical protein
MRCANTLTLFTTEDGVRTSTSSKTKALGQYMTPL